jgi:peptidoglycan/xylan/chitin deacetylase (PgdA/CDA1 family)
MMTAASAVTWPQGYSSAAAFTFDVDAESAVLWGSPSTAKRMGIISHQAYGPLVGVPRLLRVLDQHGVRATFFVPGHTADRYPQVVRDIAAAGHEIGHHGYLHEQPSGLTPEQEAVALDRGLDALERVAGVRPLGYRAPMWDLSWHTPALLADRGFLYDSTLMDADVPYELAVEPGSARSLVEIPIQWALDDWEQYCFLPEISGTGLIETPAKARELWQGEYEALTAEGGCWVLTNHPFLSGRPARARELSGLIGDVVADPASWVASLVEIAQHVRGLGLSARTVELPLVED